MSGLGRALAGFAAASALVAALASGCELAVSDTVPAFECVSGPDTCPAGQICAPALRRCVALSTACAQTGCPAGWTCDSATLACTLADASDRDGARANDAPTDDGGSAPADASVRAEQEASVDDAAATLDATVDADASSDAADDTARSDAPTGDAQAQDAGADAEYGAADGGAPDAGGPCRGLTCPCSGASDCASGVCGDVLTVTSDLYAAAGSASFCTQPCCTSADCDDSTVCFGTGAGGNYCVDPAWLSRSTTLGTGIGGAACTADSDCRSGLCASATCADTCCSTSEQSSECVSGSACYLGTFPGNSFDVHRTGFCGASASSCGISPCTACRSTADCSLFEEVCGYTPAAVGSSDIVASCVPGATGSGAQGSSCTTDSDCASGLCDSASDDCSGVCFTDADCTAAGWRCRTEVVSIQNGGGSYSVLRCGS